MNIAVLCSGSGTNLQAVIDGVKSGYVPARIVLVVSDNPAAYALTRARDAGIETATIDKREFGSREEFDNEIGRRLKEKKVELVVLAGYMRLLSDRFIGEFRNRVMNVHPALLPSFKGSHGVADALKHGVKVTGVTVHFVNEALDDGPIIAQAAVEIKEDDDEKTLLERIHKEEHRIYPEAIRLFALGRLKIEGRRVKIV